MTDTDKTLTTLTASNLMGFLKRHDIVDQAGVSSSHGKPLVVAVSGGLDSMVLLRLMLELRYQFNVSFSAVHVNHGLSQYSDKWQAFVKQFCDINDIPLHCHSINLVKLPGHSLEQLARDARYQAFAELLERNSVVLTGHHLLDQLETVMLRLARASGSKGLSGMQSIAPLPNKNGQDKGLVLCRPLLSVSKQQLEEFAQRHFLDWVEDESNQSLEFDRNYVRHKVAPVLLERWPHFAEAVNTSSGLLAKEHKLLQLYLSEELSEMCIEGVQGFSALSLTRWSKALSLKQPELIRLFVQQQTGKQLSRAVLNEILSSVIDTEADRQPLIDFAGYRIRKYRDALYCLKLELEVEPEDLALQESETQDLSVLNLTAILPKGSIDAGKEVSVTFSKQALIDRGIDLNSLLVSVKWAKTGSKFKPNEKAGRKKLSEYLKQQGCPAWLRKRIPLLFLNEELIAVYGFGVAFDWRNSVQLFAKR